MRPLSSSWTAVLSAALLASGAWFFPPGDAGAGGAEAAAPVEDGPDGAVEDDALQDDGDPVEPSVRFILNDAAGRPGDQVKLQLSVLTNVALRTVSIAINFDETLVRLLEVSRLREGPAAGDVTLTRIDNRDEAFGDQTREGFVHIEIAGLSAEDAPSVGPGETALIELDFVILPDAPFGSTEVRFADVGPVPQVSPSVLFVNAVEYDTVDGTDSVRLAPEDFDHGMIHIIGEVGFFLRGDTSLDCQRDVSDAIETINWLFHQGVEPRCLDSADANDSGELDLSDPVFTLMWLYLGGPDFSEPFASVGQDPTEDGLDCADGLGDDGCSG